jgi:hypothetical protein
MKSTCSGVAIACALAVTAMPVLAKEMPVADCMEVVPPPAATCANKTAGAAIFYLPDNADACVLAELYDGQDAYSARTSRDGGQAMLCILTPPAGLGEDEARSSSRVLLGRRLADGPALVEATIRPLRDSGEGSESDSAAPTPPPPARLVFAGRPIGIPWIAFAKTGQDLPAAERQSQTLRRVGESVNTRFPLRIEDGLVGSALRITAGPATANLDADLKQLVVSLKEVKTTPAIEVSVTNAFGEEALLRIELDRGFFAVDRSIADKQTSLALLYKLEADELYLRMSGTCDAARSGAICEASRRRDTLYQNALEMIPTCPDDQSAGAGSEKDPCRDEKLTSTWDLIRADVAYRQKLIELGLPFFGGLRFLKPTTPHQELLKMEDLLKSMERLVDDIDKLRVRIEDKNVKQAEIDARQTAALGEYQSDAIDEEIAELEESYANLDRSDYLARNEALLTEIREFETQLKNIEARIDAQSAQAAALTRSGIAAASGVPINQVEAIASGDIKRVALDFVQSQVLDPNSPLHTDLLASNEIAIGLVETANEVKTQVVRLQSFQDQAKQIEAALKGDRTAIASLINRYGDDDAHKLLQQAKKLEAKTREAIALTRSLDRKRALAFISAQLTPAQVMELDRIVETVKPVEHVIEAAYVALSEGNFEETLLKEFDTRLNAALRAARPGPTEIARMRGELKVMASTDPSALADSYFGYQVINAIDRFDSESRELVATIAAFDANLVVAHPKIKPQFHRLSSARRAAVLRALREGKEELASGLRYENDALCIERSGQRACLSFADLRTRFRSEYARATAVTADQINTFLATRIEGLSSEQVLILYVARNGAGGFAGNLRGLLSGGGEGGSNRLNKAWEAVKGANGPLFGKPDVAQSGRVAVAGALTAGQFSDPEPVPPPLSQVTSTGQPLPAAPGTDPSAGGMDPTTNAIVQGALNYALPGAGVALQLGQTWAAIDADRELQQDYVKRLAAAVREQEQLVRSLRTATQQSALANLQIQRARAVKQAGEVQIRQLNLALDQQMDAIHFSRELIALYRPQFYYIAEALRQKFDAYDRSLADWSDGVPESGFLKQAILQDPGNARLALDSEIQLFGWLNRNIESTRTSPYALFQHWRQLVGLARAYCNDNGCKPGDGKLGQIGITLDRRLFRDIQGRLAKRDFDRWRRDPNRGAPFTIAFSFAPGELGIPANALNARLIDLAVVPLDRDGNQILGNAVQLTHSGAATLVLSNPAQAAAAGPDDPRAGPLREVRQVLLPQRFMPANRLVDEDPESLRRRFQDETSVQSLKPLRILEGYGVYGSYLMEVSTDSATREIEDFAFRLTYIYKDPVNLMSETDVIARLEKSVCPVPQVDGSPPAGTPRPVSVGPILTGVVCDGKARVEYSLAELGTGPEVNCGEVIASLDLIDERSAALFRSLGRMACLKIVPTEGPAGGRQALIADLEGLEGKASNAACKRSELLLLTAFNAISRPDADVNCFGERK